MTMVSAIAFSTQTMKHPLDQIFGALGTLIFVIGFFGLLFIYFILRCKSPSKLGVTFDVIFALNYVPTFFTILLGCIYPLAKTVIKGMLA